jgi:hypothetical protein
VWATVLDSALFYSRLCAADEKIDVKEVASETRGLLNVLNF